MTDRDDHDLFGLIGYQLDGKYTIEAAVARGGFGVVYRARHAVLQTPLAVKVLRAPDDLPEALRGRFLEQFVEEARIIAQLQHPSIVRVTDFGVSIMPGGEQAPWMVLDWIEGQTLAAYLNARRGRGGQTPREVLDLLHPVIDAFAAAHERGIAHRDIKPGNIMLPAENTATSARSARRAAGGRPAARVLDFGIAKIMGDGDDGPATGQTRTHSAIPAFSPRYAAPEQSSGTRTGPWTDVHAIGLILTEMLVDRTPYEGTDKMELLAQVMSSTRPTPARFGVDVGAWEPVIARALALRPRERFADAGELLAALEADVPSTLHAPDDSAGLAPPTLSQPPPPPAVAPTITQPLVYTIPTLTPAETRATNGAQRKRARTAILMVAVVVVASLVALVTYNINLTPRHSPTQPTTIGRATSTEVRTPVVPAPSLSPVVEAPAALVATPEAPVEEPSTPPVAQSLTVPAEPVTPAAPRAASERPQRAIGGAPRRAPVVRGARRPAVGSRPRGGSGRAYEID